MSAAKLRKLSALLAEVLGGMVCIPEREAPTGFYPARIYVDTIVV